MKFLPWALLALVLAFPLFAQGQSPMSVVRVSLVGSVPLEIRVPGQPRAKDIVRIEEGTPFLVPPGRILVMTGLGHAGGLVSSWAVTIDGVLVWADKILAGSNGVGSIQEAMVIPRPGLTAQPGSTVSVAVYASQGNTSGVIIGYLEDAQ